MTYYITMTSHERNDVLIHRKFDYLFNSLFRLTISALPFLCEENHTVSPHEVSVIRKAFIRRDVISAAFGAYKDSDRVSLTSSTFHTDRRTATGDRTLILVNFRLRCNSQ